MTAQTTFSAAERRTLERLADSLIPAAPGALSASQAGIGEALLDRIIEFVPERAGLLHAVIGRAATDAAQSVLAELRRTDLAAFDTFCEIIAGAYFMSAQVREQIAYPGRIAVPARIDTTDLEDLLLPVLERGFAPRPIG